MMAKGAGLSLPHVQGCMAGRRIKAPRGKAREWRATLKEHLAITRGRARECNLKEHLTIMQYPSDLRQLARPSELDFHQLGARLPRPSLKAPW